MNDYRTPPLGIRILVCLSVVEFLCGWIMPRSRFPILRISVYLGWLAVLAFLWLRQNWARIVILVLSVLGIIDFIAFRHPHAIFSPSQKCVLIFNGLMSIAWLIYLNLNETKRYFLFPGKADY